MFGRDQGDQPRERLKWLLSNCDWGPFRLPSLSSLLPAAARSRKRNTTPAPPTPRSRSAILCPIADRHPLTCLLYTSDAADDLLCVDLGGRRIIKKKKNKN